MVNADVVAPVVVAFLKPEPVAVAAA